MEGIEILPVKSKENKDTMKQFCGRPQRNVGALAYLQLCLLVGAQCANTTSGVIQGSKQFDMVLRAEGPTGHSYNNTIVMAGQVQPQWSSQCWKSKDSGCNPRFVSEFADQLLFEFSYDSMKNFHFLYPSIKTSGGRATAEIMDYSHDMEERNGEVTIRHTCGKPTRQSREESDVELLLPLTTEIVLKIGWIKICGFGEHERLDYGIVSRQVGNKDGHLSLKGVGDEDVPIIGPAVLSTRVYLKHDEDDYSQRFSTPAVELTEMPKAIGKQRASEGLSVDLKGSGFGDIVLGKTASVFDVFYNCHRQGLWKVEAVVDIVPFKSIEMKWIKDCGGGLERRINVGTKADEGVADVVSDGVTLGRFGSRAKGSDKGMVSGKGSGTKVFFLWTTGGSRYLGGLSIGGISAHSYNDRIGKAEVASVNKFYERAPWGIAGIGEEGEIISGEVKRMIGVRVMCRRKGKVKIGVRISVHDRQGIDWWFFNECDNEGRGKEQGRMYATAEMATYVMMSGLCAMMVVTLHRASTSRVMARAASKK